MTLATVPRYDRSRVTAVGDHAVVVGASVAGLFAARVLSDGFKRVTVIERDPLPDEPVARCGAPQTSHPHVMLEAGRATAEDLFPGFGEALLAAGGSMIDAATEMKYYDRGDFLADGPNRLPMYCATRALFEHIMRQRVSALDGVRLRDGCRVTDYCLDDAGRSVTGVAFRDGGGEGTELTADLVIDATGRTSRTPRWLENHGYSAPETDVVHIDVTYSTALVERPPGDRRVLFVPPDSPRTKGGVALPVEGGRWEVIIQGVHGDDAPTDRTGFVEFARELPVPEFGRLVTDREWVSDIHHYPFPSNVRRHYDQLDRFPAGLVVTGDAIASFNPVYGQGMSVAALDALVLHHALADGGLNGLAPRFFGAAAEVVGIAWRLAVGRDFEFAPTTGPKPTGTDLFNRYVAELLRRAHSDGVLTDAFYRVFRLERPYTALLRPGIVRRVLSPIG